VESHVFDNQRVSFLRCSAFSLSKNGTVLFLQKTTPGLFSIFFRNQKIGTPDLLQLKRVFYCPGITIISLYIAARLLPSGNHYAASGRRSARAKAIINQSLIPAARGRPDNCHSAGAERRRRNDG
jgi:hypothetical protein